MRPPLNFVQAPPSPLPINMRAPRRIGRLGVAWAVQYRNGWTLYCPRMGGVVSQGNTEEAVTVALDVLLILIDQKESPMTATCRYCHTPIREDGHGAWVDATDGDGCSGDDECRNEGESHVPDDPDLDYDPIEDRIAYDDPPAYWDRDRTEGA